MTQYVLVIVLGLSDGTIQREEFGPYSHEECTRVARAEREVSEHHFDDRWVLTWCDERAHDSQR